MNKAKHETGQKFTTNGTFNVKNSLVWTKKTTQFTDRIKKFKKKLTCSVLPLFSSFPLLLVFLWLLLVSVAVSLSVPDPSQREAEQHLEWMPPGRQ